MSETYQLVLLVSCIACAMSATSILVRDPDEPMNRYASAIVFGGAFWAFCEILWNRTEDAGTALALVKLSALGWIFIGPLGMQLLLEMAGWPRERIGNLLRVLYVLAFALMLVDWTTPLIHERMVRTSWGWSYELGPTYLVFYLITTASLLAGLSVVGFDLPKWASRAERAQGLGLVCAIMVPLVIASLTDGLLPLFDVHVWHLGTASIAALGGIVTWTFQRYGYSLLAPGTFAREILETLPDDVLLLHLDGRVRFTDEGDGISDDCIFDSFSTTKSAGKGTGLGLALSYEIVRRHDDDISVQSEVGVGTCFTVVLPRPAED